MSVWSKLPDDIVKLIYEYDSTYREIMNESLKFIEHACPTCCCDGGKKNRYRHHYDIGTFAFTFWDWEWRRRNACPKHNPGDFDKDGNQTAYNWREMEYYMPPYEHQFAQNYNVPDLTVSNLMTEIQPTHTTFIHIEHDINFSRIWRSYTNATINYAVILKSLWRFCIRNQNIYPSPIKTYSRLKLRGARFMDMTHDQRPIVA